MRRTFGLGLAAAVLALGCGKGGTPSTAAGGTGIEGGWTLVSIEAGGKKDVPAPADAKFRATANTLTVTQNGKEKAIRYKLDPSKAPPEVELTSTTDGKSETMYGIYKLEGDTLTLCVVESDKPADRPKEFTTTPENKAVIMTLKKD